MRKVVCKGEGLSVSWGFGDKKLSFFKLFSGKNRDVVIVWVFIRDESVLCICLFKIVRDVNILIG